MNMYAKLLPIDFTSEGKIQQSTSLVNTAAEIPSSLIPTSAPSLTHSIPESHIYTSLQNIPNFILVWLDATINETNNSDSHHTLITLRQLADTVNTFVDTNRCIQFLNDSPNEKIYMIVSGSLGQQIVPLVHGIHQLHSIYIFCRDKSRHIEWVKKWFKIKGIFTEITPIYCELKQIIHKCERDSIPISILPTNYVTTPTELNHLDQSFMYTQILKEILLDMNFDKKSMKAFTTFCRTQFVNDVRELDIIQKFEHKYHKSKAIWWYTNECFLHRMLNRALRMMDVDMIIKMGFFIRDLHRHIEQLHRKQYNASEQVKSFLAYRGQSLSKEEFTKMSQTKGGLISFNNFLSTSKKPIIADIYARRAIEDSNLIGIVFKMLIDPLISSIPFAKLDDVSFFKGSEQEVLFSMHTIFRIGDIKQIETNNNHLWEVNLILTSDSDQQLNELTELMREETQGSNEWFRVGQLLIKLGLFNKAEELYNLLLNQKSNKIEKGYIYHQLGWIKVNLGQYTEAIAFFKKSLDITEHIRPLCLPDLATCYDNIGSVYDYMGEYIKALIFHEKALQIYRTQLPSDHPDLATSLSNIGSVYKKLNDYSKALLAHEEALEIYRKKLPSNHSSLAISYNNIGLVYYEMNDYSKALWFYNKTLEIYRNTVPSTHPDLAILHQNIGKALEKMCEYSTALSYYKKAFAIFQKNFTSDHPHLATCYYHIASVYNNMDNYSKALSFYEKALDIRQKVLSPNHPDLITLYQNMSEVYERLNEHDKALAFRQKAVDISQSTLASSHSLLLSTSYKLPEVSHNTICSSQVVPYVSHALYIEQHELSSNSTDLRLHSNTFEILKTML